ncbi:hypothetical protein OB919_15040 [Halobacteria archaeon AArc-curdl1]|uniref:Uncharacterized protein n=1 Tax=Natronosalvus hydrolyticus TaxID=2979988 RepID=A0AAP2Z9X3_9EURY|nr:hypothetical protein [Halobacteria archaeon AArc-curdl1]
MGERSHPLPVGRQGLEPLLAILVIGFAGLYFLEVPVFLPAFGAVLFELLILLLPGLLAVSVLLGVGAHAWRLVSTYIGDGKRTYLGDNAITHLLFSVALVVVAANTLWWVVGSVYFMYIARVGGIPPSIVALFAGAVLGVVVLCQAAFVRLFPAGPLEWFRGR